jgi:hypothetical protein
MASSTKNVKLGVCRVYIEGADMGLTQGGVEVAVSTETHKVNVDQYGKTAINELVMGRSLTVKVPLAETTLRNLVATMPGSVLISDGASATGTVTFASNPTATTTVTIGGQLFSFSVTKATTIYQTMIQATAAATLAEFAAVVNRSLIQPGIGYVKASVNALGTIVTLTAGDPGTAGNAVTTVAALGGVASGVTLLGGVAETKARVEVSTGIGTDLLSIAKVLRLHPSAKADADFSEDFVVFQAATAGALTFAYKVDAERVYNVEFTGYPDSTGRIFSVGDPLA